MGGKYLVYDPCPSCYADFRDGFIMVRTGSEWKEAVCTTCGIFHEINPDTTHLFKEVSPVEFDEGQG